MRILVFDPFCGASGDMVLGSLLALGADRITVSEAMQSVVAEPSIDEVDRAGIRAVRVITHATPVHRTIEEVIGLVRAAKASAPALAMAERVFQRLHAAESSVHGKQAHFHEVGADDAIADVIGACTALLSLDVDGVAVLPVSLGRGFIKGDHGIYPAPGPATVAILRESGLQVRIGTEDEGELCTPTGAALLSEFSTMAPPAGAYTLLGIGYGAGTRDPPRVPNVLRAMLVETPSPFGHDTVDVLETNVDDVSGEVIAYTMGRLMDAGARDVSALPAVMKKGRSGHLIRVICRVGDSVRLAEILAAELGTLGIRCTTQVHRLIAERSFERVSVEIGGRIASVEVKCSWKDGKVAALKAEYEQAKAIAEEFGVPLRDVLRSVEEEAWRQCAHRNGP